MLKSAEYWIENLHLEPHPEGSWFRETYRSSREISESGLPFGFSGNRKFSTAIYYMLPNHFNSLTLHQKIGLVFAKRDNIKFLI